MDFHFNVIINKKLEINISKLVKIFKTLLVLLLNLHHTINCHSVLKYFTSRTRSCLMVLRLASTYMGQVSGTTTYK